MSRSEAAAEYLKATKSDQRVLIEGKAQLHEG